MYNYFNIFIKNIFLFKYKDCICVFSPLFYSSFKSLLKMHHSILYSYVFLNEHIEIILIIHLKYIFT